MVKLPLVGLPGIGKTSILQSYLKNIFTEQYKPTVGISFKIKHFHYQNIYYLIQIWDIGKSEDYYLNGFSLYSIITGVLLIYDITRKSSFEFIQKETEYIENIFKDNEKSRPIMYIVGNKSDLKMNRKVKRSEVIDFSNKHNIKYYECSAYKGKNISEVFTCLVRDITEKELSAVEKKKPFVKEINESCIVY